MKYFGETVRLTATDISNHLVCRHLTSLNSEEGRGERASPPVAAPHLVVIQQRGLEHERAYIEFLKAQGLSAVDLREGFGDAAAVAETERAMKGGVDLVIQGALRTGDWFGRPDILRRTERASELGAWSYEPYDCKLARETKAATILQLSHYAALLAGVQGRLPDRMYVVPPSEDFAVEQHRVLHYAAYYRAVRARG